MDSSGNIIGLEKKVNFKLENSSKDRPNREIRITEKSENKS